MKIQSHAPHMDHALIFYLLKISQIQCKINTEFNAIRLLSQSLKIKNRNKQKHIIYTYLGEV